MKLIIGDLRPWDGEYDFNIDSFDRREWGWIKRYAGYLPATVWDGYVGGDVELYAVFALIALKRNGRIGQTDVPDLWERLQEGGKITLKGEPQDEKDEEDDARPPAESSTENEISSGEDTGTSSETSLKILPGTGGQSLDTSESSQAM